MENTKSMSCFLLGIGVGAAAGMLFAPKSGTDTRNYLQAKGRDAVDALKCEGQELRDQAGEAMERGKQGVLSQVRNLTDAVDTGKRAFRETVEKSRTGVEA